MSLNREVALWQSSGGYYIGFYECWVIGDDPEWDVDYDFSSFEWASGPHPSKEAAWDSWHGANPGGYCFYEEGSEECAKLDEMFRSLQEARRRDRL